MYSREEASKIREQFWIAFGKYMKPIPSAEGMTINWVNYKTGVKHIFFRMEVVQQEATIAIQITHPDHKASALYFEQFASFKRLLEDALGEEWKWQASTINESGALLSQISKTLSGVSIYNQHDWPKLISFLKPRIMALDEFWVNVKPVFEAL